VLLNKSNTQALKPPNAEKVVQNIKFAYQNILHFVLKFEVVKNFENGERLPPFGKRPSFNLILQAF
jgi:hypothetical protein